MLFGNLVCLTDVHSAPTTANFGGHGLCPNLKIHRNPHRTPSWKQLTGWWNPLRSDTTQASEKFGFKKVTSREESSTKIWKGTEVDEARYELGGPWNVPGSLNSGYPLLWPFSTSSDPSFSQIHWFFLSNMKEQFHCDNQNDSVLISMSNPMSAAASSSRFDPFQQRNPFHPRLRKRSGSPGHPPRWESAHFETGRSRPAVGRDGEVVKSSKHGDTLKYQCAVW